jgi:hypothetical protein
MIIFKKDGSQFLDKVQGCRFISQRGRKITQNYKFSKVNTFGNRRPGTNNQEVCLEFGEAEGNVKSARSLPTLYLKLSDYGVAVPYC